MAWTKERVEEVIADCDEMDNELSDLDRLEMGFSRLGVSMHEKYHAHINDHTWEDVIRICAKEQTAKEFAVVLDNPNNIYDIPYQTEELQIAAVRANGWSVQYTKGPSDEVQIAAVSSTPLAIQYIYKPSEKVQVAAVTADDRALQHIEEVCPAAQIAALCRGREPGKYDIGLLLYRPEKFSPEVLDGLNPAIRKGLKVTEELGLEGMEQVEAVESFIASSTVKEKSVSVDLAALGDLSSGNHSSLPTQEDNETTVRHAASDWMDEVRDVVSKVRQPSAEVQLEAVRLYGYDAYKHLDEPTEDMQMALVEKNSAWLEFLPDATPAIQLAALRDRGDLIEHIENPSEELQLAAVKQLGASLYFLPEASDAVKMEGIKQNPYSIQYIGKPTEEMQRTAMTHGLPEGQYHAKILLDTDCYAALDPDVLEAIRPGTLTARESVMAIYPHQEDRIAMLTQTLNATPATNAGLLDLTAIGDLSFDTAPAEDNTPTNGTGAAMRARFAEQATAVNTGNRKNDNGFSF